MGVGSETMTPISKSNQRNQTISVVVDGIAQYLASVDERETISCFLLFQEKKESPRKIQNSVVDLRSVGSLAQSASK